MPSILLALVCLAVVRRVRPRWVCVELAEACRAEGLSAERLSRLATRARGPFEEIIAAQTRVGRPPRDSDAGPDGAEQAAASINAALLSVTTTLLGRLGRRCSSLKRELLVGAWLRLGAEHPTLTKARFCSAMALSERTLRHWLATTPLDGGNKGAPPPPRDPKPTPPKPKPKRPNRRPRFGFDLIVPGTQLAADTTDLRAFGVPLKLIATQDIGGRDRDLLDSVLVDDHENAERVVRVLREALEDKPGAQMITDQGTPYLAEATRRALDELDAEHAPQREGHPQGKATIERAFGVAKSIARPLLGLSDRVAAALPALRRPEIAKAFTTLVLVTVLRAYQAGARAARRADEARATVGMTTEQLARIAQDNRAQARAEMRSKRLLLEHIHSIYDMPRSRAAFVRALRIYPLSVLLKAEQGFRRQAHRADIRDRHSYFAAIVRSEHEAYAKSRARHHQQRDEDDRRQRENDEVKNQRNRWEADPVEWLRAALRDAAAQWDPDTRRWSLGEPIGQARVGMQLAAEAMTAKLGPTAAFDLASAVFDGFARKHQPTLGGNALTDLRRNLQRHLPNPERSTQCPAQIISAMLEGTGPPTRPTAPEPLRR